MAHSFSPSPVHFISPTPAKTYHITCIRHWRMHRSTRRSRKARLHSSSNITRPHRDQPPLPDTTEFSSNCVNTGPFSNSRNFVVNNSTFYNIQGGQDIVALGIDKLSKCAINGAEYDSSLRDPPPQCHPGTRVELQGKINTWFYNKEREKALLWLNGPAGVGKSAVIQTFAESLAESECLGAALFFSRPNDRKDPQRVFTTIAFQLATRIPTYRSYITEQIALNPSLLNKGMKEQFRTFIVKPFGNRLIGSGEGPWGVLLDGLDECEGVDEQCRIVHLVSEFISDFPSAPLVWAISSRPEPHIVSTFADAAIAPTHWSEYIPIDSTEACQDVERYLNSSFEAMRKRYSYIPSNWPSETQFLKLTSAALGLFVFARTAARFMEDPNHADPISRLTQLLSVIDHLDVEVTDDHPFALLDALYNQILAPIPPALWRTTKRILGFILCASPEPKQDGLSYPLKSRSLTGASVILGLEQSVVHSALHKLHSVLEIPRQNESSVSFLHASFGDYLVDRTRSKDFSVDRGESVDEITRCLYRLYLDKPWNSGWTIYASQPLGRAGSFFYEKLKCDAESSLLYAVSGSLRTERGRGPFVSQQDRSECLDILTKIDITELYQSSESGVLFTDFLFKLWKMFPEDLINKGACKQLKLHDLELDHLNHTNNKPISVSYSVGSRKKRSVPDSLDALQTFTTKLRSLRRVHPDETVLICGTTPEKMNAVFIQVNTNANKSRALTQHFCLPYPS